VIVNEVSTHVAESASHELEAHAAETHVPPVQVWRLVPSALHCVALAVQVPAHAPLEHPFVQVAA
jgi:hypothetical protein